MDELIQFLKAAGLTFVPLFIAIDAISVVPIALSLSGQVTPRERTRMMNIAALTAAGVGLLFLFLGRLVLRLLGISVDHFAIAGGLTLMVLALRDLLSTEPEPVPRREEMVEVVPIGTPLLAGPATITTILLFSDLYGIGPVLLAFAANLLLAWVILHRAGAIVALLGHGGLIALAKVTYMFLAAIAVRMMVQGVRTLFF